MANKDLACDECGLTMSDTKLLARLHGRDAIIRGQEREPFERWYRAKLESGIEHIEIAFGMFCETVARLKDEATETAEKDAVIDELREEIARLKIDADRYLWIADETIQDARDKPFGVAIAIASTERNSAGHFDILEWGVAYGKDANSEIDNARANDVPNNLT